MEDVYSFFRANTVVLITRGASVGEDKRQQTTTRTATVEEVEESGPFQRYSFLDRPFLTQSPGFEREDAVALAADHAGLLQLRQDAEHPTHSVNDIVALLKTDRRNRHFETGGSAGVRRQRKRRAHSRIAGKPISKQ